MNPLHAQEAATAKQFLTATPKELAAAETLENEDDSKKYEAKVARLLRRAHNRDGMLMPACSP
jgi:hypothetical protein